MRLDKFLKVSRIIKRRSVAKDFADTGYVLVNDKKSKPSTQVSVGDILTISSKNVIKKYKIINIFEFATEEKAKTMFEELK